MKKATIIICLLSGVSLFSQDNAIRYLSMVDANIRTVQAANLEYILAASNGKPEIAEQERQELIQTLALAHEQLASLPSFDGSTKLRDSAMSFLRISHALIIEDYGRVISLEPVAERSFDAMEAYIGARAAAQSRLKGAGAMVEHEYLLFARRHGFDIKPSTDALSSSITNASKAYAHYNAVYDVFFRNYKQESYLLDAISLGHISAIDQNLAALERSATTGLGELRDINPFGDDRLVAACRNLLSFYRNEATGALAGSASFFIDKDDLERRTQILTAAREGETEKAALQKHEEASAEFRKRNDSFSKTNSALAQKRDGLVQNFQKEADLFMKKYVK